MPLTADPLSAANEAVDGKVTAIAITDTVSNNVVEYAVTVALTNPPANIKIGQTASLSITTATAANVLYVQSAALTKIGPTTTATVEKDGAQKVVTVTTGLAGDNGTEVKSGLSAGDVVVLPQSSTGTGSGGFTFPGGGLGGGLGGGIGGAG